MENSDTDDYAERARGSENVTNNSIGDSGFTENTSPVLQDQNIDSNNHDATIDGEEHNTADESEHDSHPNCPYRNMYPDDGISFPPPDPAELQEVLALWGKPKPKLWEKINQQRQQDEHRKRLEAEKAKYKELPGRSLHRPFQTDHVGQSGSSLLPISERNNPGPSSRQWHNDRNVSNTRNSSAENSDKAKTAEVIDADQQLQFDGHRKKLRVEREQSKELRGQTSLGSQFALNVPLKNPIPSTSRGFPEIDQSARPTNTWNTRINSVRQHNKTEPLEIMGVDQNADDCIIVDIYSEQPSTSNYQPSRQIVNVMPNRIVKQEAPSNGNANVIDLTYESFVPKRRNRNIIQPQQIECIDLSNDRYLTVGAENESSRPPRNESSTVKDLPVAQRTVNVDGHLLATSAFALNIIGTDNAENQSNERIKTWRDIEEASNEVRKRYSRNQSHDFMVDRERVLARLRQLCESNATMPKFYELAPQPNCLSVQLHDFQLYGLAWMLWRETQDPKGGILADDMGLGKTVMILALILAKYDEQVTQVRGKHVTNATLIICPSDLLNQWRSELESKSSYPLRIFVHHGPNKIKSMAELKEIDVLLTSYNVYVAEHSMKTCVATIYYKRAVLDESHLIRNESASRSQACVEILAQHKWAVTGTPIHNRIEDLAPTMVFLDVQPFHEKPIWTKWLKGEDGIGRLNVILKCLLLRRTKQDLVNACILELPQKLVSEDVIEMAPEEMQIYKRLLVFSKSIFIAFANEHFRREGATTRIRDSDPSVESIIQRVRQENSGLVTAQQIMTLIIRLRQFCCHPCLISQMLNPEEDELVRSSMEESAQEDVNQNNNVYSDLLFLMNENNLVLDSVNRQDQGFNHNNKIFSARYESTKIKHLITRITPILFDTNDKIIIVSEWTSLLQIVFDHLNELGFLSCFYTGSVSSSNRAAIKESFNNDNNGPRIMLLSLTCGGIGLNLTGANHMFILTIHWNPQLEKQVQDRVYRVGQTKPVAIYRILISNSIEERVNKLQNMKIETARRIIQGDTSTSEATLNMENLIELFGL